MNNVRAKNFSPQHHRRSIRVQGYDYSQEGLYFITICCHNRQNLFGEIVEGKMQLNDAGHIVHQCWDEIPNHFPHAALDEFVIMPNHVHGIICIVDTPPTAVTADDVGADVGAKNFSPLPPPQPSPQRPRGTSKTIGSIVRGFKIGVTKWMRHNTPVHDVWQRNYYEHIIRNDAALERIRNYIVNNPAQWEQDSLHPATK